MMTRKIDPIDFARLFYLRSYDTSPVTRQEALKAYIDHWQHIDFNLISDDEVTFLRELIQDALEQLTAHSDIADELAGYAADDLDQHGIASGLRPTFEELQNKISDALLQNALKYTLHHARMCSRHDEAVLVEHLPEVIAEVLELKLEGRQKPPGGYYAHDVLEALSHYISGEGD